MKINFKIIIYFISLFFIGCQVPIKWNVVLESNDGSFMMINKFKSSENKKLIIDRKAFSYNCYYSEDINLSNEKLPSPDDFKYSQVIIENQKGERRLFSNIFFDKNEIKELAEENCMFDWFEFLDLNRIPKKIVIDIPYLSDIKVSSKDKKVRFYYLFKASDKQIIDGYLNTVVISNWIKIPTGTTGNN